MGSKDLVDMAVYAVLGAIPYLDLDILGVIAGIPIIGHLIAWIPYIEPIHLSDIGGSTEWVILIILVVVPYVDLEIFKLLEKFGIQGFESFNITSESGGDQGSYVNEDGEIVTTDGGVRRGNGSNSNGSGSGIKKIFMIGAPILIIIFLLGSGYLSLASSEIGYQAAGLDTPAIGATVAQAVKTIECVGNVACVRQWQFNNTQRPGSEEVGQEYKLKIDNFDVNDGFPLDVANRRKGDRVPADFSVYNPRHGLKGIEARNVAYRIKVYDNLGSITGLSECQTGWKPLGGEYAEDNDFGENGTILPGGFATPLGTHSDLTLENCGLLQPALGIKRRVKLQIAYDYSSQSTLQVQAMSNENLRSLNERPGFKKSQTADTPVKTYVNVESPITYRVNEDGSAESSVFGVRLGFETGQRNIKYRVNTSDFQLYDSSQTVDVETSDAVDSGVISCEDLKSQGGDRYTFSEEMTEYLSSRQSGSWFESNSGPSPARCSMVLENPGSISPTGETLTFRIDANYTVMLEEMVDGFKIQNSRCERFECPMLVPNSHENVSDDGNLISKCDTRKRVDANNGCGARMGEDWRNVGLDYALNGSIDSIIEQRETAYELNVLLGDLRGYVESSYNKEDVVIGLESETVQKLKSDRKESFAALSTLQTRNYGQDVKYKQIERILCSNDDASKSEFRKIWESKHPGDLIYFNQLPPQNCAQENVADFVLELYTWSLYESPKEEFDRVDNDCEGAVVISNSGMECYS